MKQYPVNLNTNSNNDPQTVFHEIQPDDRPRRYCAQVWTLDNNTHQSVDDSPERFYSDDCDELRRHAESLVENIDVAGQEDATYGRYYILEWSESAEGYV